MIGSFVQMNTEALPVILMHGEGDILHAFGEEVIVHLSGAQTAGKAGCLSRQSPAGFETFFARCAQEFAKPGGPDRQHVVAISSEHGIHFVGP